MSFQIEKVKAILFDIDGTLSDTDDHMVRQLARFLTPFFPDADRKKAFARWMVMAAESPGNYLYNLADRFALDSAMIRVMQRMTKNQQHRLKVYWLIPGVKDMLQSLARYPMGIVSARDAQTTMAFLRQFDLERFFDVIVTSQTCRYTKPFPDPLFYASNALDIPPENCLMVGDTTVDMKAAQLAGMQAAGVLCGFGREKELLRAGADVILSSSVALTKLFAD
jgi:HAD superfamily hydrolase (TIGR01549 family)